MPVTVDNPLISRSNTARSFTAVFSENAQLGENLLLGVVVWPRPSLGTSSRSGVPHTSSSLVHILFERKTWQLEEEAKRRTISLW
ncbi:hypothetical protein Aduo_005555 [Ancylostoma duodenale]